VVSQRLLVRADGHGRVAAFEVLIGTPAVRAMVREGKTHQLLSTMETNVREGMQTMDRAVMELARSGAISIDEAARYMRNPAALKSLGDG
jgi:twitching motility protein PilT